MMSLHRLLPLLALLAPTVSIAVAAACTTATPCKVLYLHGGGGSGSECNFGGVQALQTALGSGYSFVCTNAPYSPGLWVLDPPGGGKIRRALEQPSSSNSKSISEKDTDSVRARIEDDSDLAGAGRQLTTSATFDQLSYEHLDNIVSTQGPFKIIMGYSQGGAYVTSYLAWRENTYPSEAAPFNGAAIFCGYLQTTHAGIMARINAAEPLGTPAMVWIPIKKIKQSTNVSELHLCSDFI